MYSLNGIDLATYGIVVSDFKGYLDMPKRMGKTEQSWPDENGIQAFTDADDIRFDGRDLTIIGYFEAASHSGLIDTVNTFVDAIQAYTDLVDLVSPYETHSVLLKQGVKVTYRGDNYADVTIVFREPVADFTGTIGTGSGGNNTIDGFSFFSDYSIKVTEIKGRYLLNKMKPFNPVQYSQERYSIEKYLTSDIVVSGYCEDLSKIPDLYALLASSGERTLNLQFDNPRLAYVKDGCKFKWIKSGKGLIEMKFRFIDFVDVEYDYLVTEAGDYITTEAGDRIILN